MSKILIIPDIHYCQNASLIQSRGKAYSTRIENCIQSINWCEKLAIDNQCTSVVYLGDFFDADNLDSEVLSSLTAIHFNSLPHFCLAGNHEISTTNNEYSSIKLLQNFENVNVITQPETIENDKVFIHLLPYMYDIDENISQYFDFSNKTKKHILLTHNDLKGIQYGCFISKSGLNIDQLDEQCDLVINGHIHNKSWINNKILNLGILTGKNLQEDAFKYSHCVCIIDTDNFELTEYENPFAFNFYAFDIESENDLCIIDSLKNQAAVVIRCNQALHDKVKEKIKATKNIIASRVTILKQLINKNQALEALKVDLSVKHLDKLKEFCLNKIENTDALIAELQEICK